MLLGETIRISLASIRGNLFRALLTMLGIIIGVGAVITMVALGTGAQRAIDEQMAAFGGDILEIESSAWFSRGVARNQQTLTTADAAALSKGMTHVSDVVPEITMRFQVKYGNQNTNARSVGTTPNYTRVHNFEIAHGRMFSAGDDAARKRVVVLGSSIPELLDTKPAAIIGRTVQIRGISFEVIGVMASKGSQGWRNPDEFVWLPLSTTQFRVTGNEFVESISAKVAENSTMQMAMLEIERILRREHGVLPGNDNDFAIMDRTQFAESRQEATAVFTYLLAGIAGVSLVVGGIGIIAFS